MVTGNTERARELASLGTLFIVSDRYLCVFFEKANRGRSRRYRLAVLWKIRMKEKKIQMKRLSFRQNWTTSETRHARQRVLRAVLLVSMLAVLGGICIGIFWYARHVLHAEEDVVTKPSKERLEDFLASAGLPYLRVHTAAGGMLVVSGFVPSDAHRNTLRTALAELGYGVRVQVLTGEEIREVLRGLLLESSVLDPEVVVAEDGMIKVSGYFQRREDLERFRRVVDIEYSMDIFPLEWNTRTFDDAERDLRNLLSENFRDLHITRGDRFISVHGQIDALREESYRNVLRDFLKLHKNSILRDEVKNVNVSMVTQGPSLEVEAVVLGKHRFLVTSSGKKMLEGEDAGGGYVIKSIERNRIVLRRGEEEREIVVQPNIIMKYAR